jgi:hypothetical protein
MSEFKLQRYTLGPYQIQLELDPDGEWVKWADIEPLLKAYLATINKREEKLVI